MFSKKLNLSNNPPYDAFQAFVRDNHIALKGVDNKELSDLNFAVKDVFKILGSTYGNGHPKWLETNNPDNFTSPMISKLLELGADLVGKTVCDELCFSISGENWHYGSPINPHDPKRFSGGSSSGSAVAVSGGLVDFSLGSDCLGSVRVPASYTGVFGMRPTYGRVDNKGEAPYCESMDVLGYMANKTDIFSRISKIILEDDIKETKFDKLIIAKDCFNSIDKDVNQMFEPVVQHFLKQFPSVEELNLSEEGLDKWVEIFRIIQGYEVWESYGGWINKFNPKISRGPKERLEWASTITLEEYKTAYSQRQDIIDRLDYLLGDNNLILMPTAASVAPLRTETLEEINRIRAQSSNLLAISPLTGTPQITLPMVWKDNNLPLGVSLIGPRDTDLSLVDLSLKLYEDYI